MFFDLGFEMSRGLSVPRTDQAALNSDADDLSELLSVVSCSSSDTTASTAYSGDVRNIDGSDRLFSAQNKIYLLPLDQEEFRRLDKQHSLLRIGMTGLFPAKGLVDSIIARYKGAEVSVLDIGCGSGQWGLDLVAEYQQIRLTAIDQLEPIFAHFPQNIKFIRHDVNQGLRPYYEQYDIVHCRCIASGVRSYRHLLQEAQKCLKPGGVAIFIEGDFDLVSEDQKSIQEPASDANPNGSWLQRWMQAVRMAQVKRCRITDSDDSPETLDKGLWQFPIYDPCTCGVGSIFTPTSPWPQGAIPEETLHFKVAGVLMRQNLKMFLEATEQLLIESGISREETALWKRKTREEMDGQGGQFRTWFRWRAAWGCAPMIPNDSPDQASSRPREEAKPSMIYGPQTRAARQFLLSKVDRFSYQQLHVFNKREALTNLEKRNGIPHSTRGRF